MKSRCLALGRSNGYAYAFVLLGKARRACLADAAMRIHRAACFLGAQHARIATVACASMLLGATIDVPFVHVFGTWVHGRFFQRAHAKVVVCSAQVCVGGARAHTRMHEGGAARGWSDRAAAAEVLVDVADCKARHVTDTFIRRREAAAAAQRCHAPWSTDAVSVANAVHATQCTVSLSQLLVVMRSKTRKSRLNTQLILLIIIF